MEKPLVLMIKRERDGSFRGGGARTGNSKDFFLEMNTQFLLESCSLDTHWCMEKNWLCYSDY